ncbi:MULTISPECIES: hypothetical protein [unclassified Pseudofrankia]|uniref:hypothetical protein n=1 Tax=unclassified Pseudofrankia TaxID=2994372 RepID=UPI0009F48E34|nr:MULTISPECIES: hypothetical protein [unclassified Pseudofrankia]MDT3442863.1 hypothetical protein [Pseudofrankia sp. BMG5.37]
MSGYGGFQERTRQTAEIVAAACLPPLVAGAGGHVPGREDTGHVGMRDQGRSAGHAPPPATHTVDTAPPRASRGPPCQLAEDELRDVADLEQHATAVYLSKPAARLNWNILNRLVTEAPPPADTEAILYQILRET